MLDILIYCEDPNQFVWEEEKRYNSDNLVQCYSQVQTTISENNTILKTIFNENNQKITQLYLIDTLRSLTNKLEIQTNENESEQILISEAIVICASLLTKYDFPIWVSYLETNE